MKQSQNTRGAFTLIELLVVIGIITLLLALLTPTATGVLERARELQCASNQRQLVMACINYAGDNNGVLPINQKWVIYPSTWLTLDGITNGYIYPYIRDPRPYLCPSFYRFVRPFQPGATRSYGMNYRVALKSDTGDGALPYPNWNNSIGAKPDCPPGWAFDVHKGLTGTNTDGALWTYLRDQRLYHCPNDRSASTPGVSLNLKLTSYVMNGAACGGGNITKLAPYYACRYTQFQPADVLFWEGSVSAMGSSGDMSSGPKEGMTFRHNDTGAYACFDGHSDYISSVAFTAIGNSSARNHFWCNPMQLDGHGY